METKVKQSELVTNPVYYNLQPYDRELASAKSKILYANSFSGLDPVEMNPELKELFEDDSFNLTAINFRRQLEDILELIDDGPWYIDGVNGVLHIHNRRICDPFFTYRYQDENGEVLKVQIITNWTTGTTAGTVASALTPNKGYDYLKYKTPKSNGNTPQQLLPSRYGVKISMDNTENYGSVEPVYEIHEADGKVTYGNTTQAYDAMRMGGQAYAIPNSRRNLYVDAKIEMAQTQKAIEKGEREKQYNQDALEGKTVYPASERTLESWEKDSSQGGEIFGKEMDEAIQKVGFKGYGGEATAEAAEKAYQATVKYGDRVIIPEEIKDILQKTKIVQDDLPSSSLYRDEKRVGTKDSEVTTVKPQVKTTQSGKGMPSIYKYNVPKSSGVSEVANTDEEIKNLIKKHGFTVVTTYGPTSSESYNPEVYQAYLRAVKDAKSKDPNAAIGGATMSWDESGHVQWHIKVAGIQGREISAYDYAMAKHRRDDPSGGVSVRARQKAYLNAMRNRAAKAKHKEIEVQMVVVGRPGIAAGQYLNIFNIGNKYSGHWYIKTCIHQMDSNGYTCSLTLKKNSNPSGAVGALNTEGAGKTLNIYKDYKFGDGMVKLHPFDVDAFQWDRNHGNQAGMDATIDRALILNEEGKYTGPINKDPRDEYKMNASGAGLKDRLEDNMNPRPVETDKAAEADKLMNQRMETQKAKEQADAAALAAKENLKKQASPKRLRQGLPQTPNSNGRSILEQIQKR